MEQHIIRTSSFFSLGVLWSCIFGICAVWVYKKRPAITTSTFQRNMYIDLVLCAVISVSTLIERPLNFYAGLNTERIGSQDFLMFRIALSTVVIQSLAWLTWMKLICAYFSFKCAEVQQRRQWTIFLDPALWEADEVWYENRRGTYGSPMYWVKFAVIHMGIVTTVGWLDVLYLGSGAVWSVMNAMTMFMVFGATVYMWVTRTPLFHDAIGLRYQAKWFVFSIVVSICVWIPLYGTAIFVKSDEFRAVRYLSNYIYSYWAGYLLVVVPLKHLIRQSQSEDEKPCESIESVLSNEMKFIAFMDHLLSEFAHENMLFIIEASQYEEHFLSRATKFERARVSIPEEIARSAIVFEEVDEKEDEMYVKALKIHEKYVDPKAVNEINVSWATRKKWVEYFDPARFSQECTDSEMDFDPNTIFELLDDAMDEILGMLPGCLSRFNFDGEYYSPTSLSRSIEVVEGLASQLRSTGA